MIVGLPVGMVKKIKIEWFTVNQSKIRINFADGVKNFHNLNLKRILGLNWSSGGELDGARIVG